MPLVWLLVASASFANEPMRVEITRWGTLDGLPQISVTAIAEAPDGRLHVATFAGLAWFDGVDFRQWDPAGHPELPSIRTTAVAVDGDGTRWAGLQDGGVVRLSDDHLDVLPRAPGLAGLPVWGLLPDGDTLWAAGWGGVARWDGSDWTAIDGVAHASSLASWDGRTWLGTDEGLWVLEGDAARPWPGFEGAVVADLTPAATGLWVASDAGVAQIRPWGSAQVDDEPALRVAQDAQGRVWVAREDRVVALGTAVSVPVHGTRDLMVAREGEVWIGTDREGLVRLNPRPWDLIAVADGVQPVLVARDGATWVGRCVEPGLLRVDGGVVYEEPLPAGICVRALHESPDGALWVGADTLALRRDTSGDWGAAIELPASVLSLATDPDGTLWIGTDGAGAWRVVDGAPEPVEGLLDPRVLALVNGPDGALWIGTQWGLAAWRGGVLRTWTRQDGVPPGAVRTVFPEADGRVWIGTYGGGLGLLRGDSVVTLTSSHGLVENVVSAILRDDRGHLWLNGNLGLSRVSIDDVVAAADGGAAEIRHRRWPTPEGNGGNQPAGVASAGGDLLVASIDGLVVMHPDRIVPNAVPPEPILLDVRVDGQPVPAGDTGRFPPGPGRVNAAFTAAVLGDPYLARFQYRMVGLGDQAWVDAGRRRTAQWDALPPGRYALEVRAANEDGVWSVRPASVSFELAPRFAARTDVRVGLALLIVLLAVLLHRLRTTGIERRSRELQAEVETRREVERRLRVSEAHYRQVFEGTGDALLVVSPQGDVVGANLEAHRLFGAEAVGRPVAALLGRQDHDAAAWRFSRPDGGACWARVTELSFGDDGSRLVTVSDVTERVAWEAHRLELERDLGRAKRLEALGSLAGGVAHDFNNLLTAMMGTASILRADLERGELGAEAAALVDTILECSDRGKRLTLQLLAFARRQPLAPERFDPVALARDLRPMLRSTLRDDVKVAVELSPDPLGVYADPAQLELALVNLALNAQAAMPEGGDLVFTVRTVPDEMARDAWPHLPLGPEHWVVLEVRDTGAGIPPEELTRVLEPFYTTRTDGSGLGLPSVHGFAVQSGGALQLSSTVGKGTTVSIVLPAVDPPESRPRAEPDEPRAIGAGQRVLVCDDDDAVRRALVRMLEHAGFITIAFSHGEEVLAGLRGGLRCDLIITDVLMPGMNGPELVRRARELRPDLNAVFVSGYTEQVTGEHLPGALVSKPFRPQELIAAIERAVRSGPTALPGFADERQE